MVTLEPREKTIICNKCETKIGVFKGDLFEQSEDVDIFMRLRVYDVDPFGEPLHKVEYEVDFCEDCLKEWEKVIKKFKITLKTVPSRGSS